MRPDHAADGLVFFGALVAWGGWLWARTGVRLWRRPVEETLELRRRLEERGVPKYAWGLPRDPRPWTPFLRLGAAWHVVLGGIVLAAGVALVAIGVYQIVRWRLL